MRVGLLAHWSGSDPETSDLEPLLGAERVGFDALWLVEQWGLEEPRGLVEQGRLVEHGAVDDGVLLRAAALAQRTHRIRLGIVGPPPPSLHPLRLAEDLAMLDLVSEGRLDWIPVADSAARASEVAETIEVVLRAWRGEAFAHSGRHHAFPELVCLPCPHQSPHPPVWLPSGSPRPSAAEAPALGHWVDDRGDIEGSARPGEPRALICALALDTPAGDSSRGAHAGRRVSRIGSARRSDHVPISLQGDRGRCLDGLSRLLGEVSPDWLIIAPPAAVRPDEPALAEWLSLVAAAIAR